MVDLLTNKPVDAQVTAYLLVIMLKNQPNLTFSQPGNKEVGHRATLCPLLVNSTNFIVQMITLSYNNLKAGELKSNVLFMEATKVVNEQGFKYV